MGGAPVGLSRWRRTLLQVKPQQGRCLAHENPQWLLYSAQKGLQAPSQARVALYRLRSASQSRVLRGKPSKRKSLQLERSLQERIPSPESGRDPPRWCVVEDILLPESLIRKPIEPKLHFRFRGSQHRPEESSASATPPMCQRLPCVDSKAIQPGHCEERSCSSYGSLREVFCGA